MSQTEAEHLAALVTTRIRPRSWWGAEGTSFGFGTEGAGETEGATQSQSGPGGWKRLARAVVFPAIVLALLLMLALQHHGGREGPQSATPLMPTPAAERSPGTGGGPPVRSSFSDPLRRSSQAFRTDVR